MPDIGSLLKNLRIFQDLSEEEINLIADSSEERSFKSGEVIFSEGDPSGTLFVILSGVVQISTMVMEDLEKPLVTLRDGSVFGEVSLIDQNPREVRATSMEDTKVLALESEAFDKILNEKPNLGSKILRVLTKTVVNRIRMFTDQYRRNVQWGLEVSGALKLNWHRLITDEVEVSLELVNGKVVEGRFLKVDEGSGGYDLFIKDSADKVSILPYHAVTRISFNRLDVMAARNEENE